MTTMWKVVYGQAAPVEVLAEKPEWPNKDADGDQIFENTHFTDEAEAWKKHELEHLSWVQLTARDFRETQQTLQQRQAKCAEAALLYADVLDAKKEWEGSRA